MFFFPKKKAPFLKKRGPNVAWSDMHPHYRIGALLKKQAFDKPFVNPSTGERGVISRTRVAVLYRDLSLDDADILLASRVPAATPLFFSLSSVNVGVASSSSCAGRLLVLENEGEQQWLPSGRARLLRHAEKTGVEVVRSARSGDSGAGDAVVTRCEKAATEASARGARVALVGRAPDSAESAIESIPSLSWLLPERIGLRSYESHDEGLAEWHTLRKR